MNKAFCKEPDSSLPPRCPRCGADGLPVGPETLRAHLGSDAAESLGEPAYWCATDACPVAYFDLFERSVDSAAAHGLYWPKDPAGPLCCCHGLSVDDIDADLAEPVPSRAARWPARCRLRDQEPRRPPVRGPSAAVLHATETETLTPVPKTMAACDC
jgi:hypothetical protein